MTYVVGVDFGTLSARALIVRAADGAEMGSAVHEYPHAVMERTLASSGAELPPQWALQDPSDYVDVLRHAVPAAVRAAGIRPDEVVGIATDFTASTPLPVLADGTPLCRAPGFEDRPHAYVKLWKHHAAQRAGRPHQRAGRRARRAVAGPLRRAHLLRVGVRQGAAGARRGPGGLRAHGPLGRGRGLDRLAALRASRRATRARPATRASTRTATTRPRTTSRALDERFADFVAAKLSPGIDALGARAGDLTAEAAAWTGLPEGIAVAVGNVDAHVTAPAAQAIAPGRMLIVMGTSNCHVMNGEQVAEVPGMCGVVDGGIAPGLWGFEAGQTGVGDIFGWFTENAVPPRYHNEAQARGLDLHTYLSQLAGEQEVGAHGLVALDWNNGNRSVLVDHELSGLILGLTLATRAEDIYRALIESTAFGTRMILETFAEAGVPVQELYVAGGLIKNPVVMQIYCDVARMPLHMIGSDQGPAFGSAMHAAVAAGVHADIHAAAAAMGSARRDAYVPDAARADVYDTLFAHYRRLHDHFGRGGDDVMHALRDLRPRELAHG